MQISYENTFDHWVAAQLFETECGVSSKLKKHDSKKFIQLLILLIIIDAFFFFTKGPNAFSAVFTLYIVFLILINPTLRRNKLRKLIYQRLKLAYGQALEEEKDKIVQWEATPEQIITREADRELRLKLDSIRKIVVCPQYLFLELGLGSCATLPRQAIVDADYNAFCAYLINLYKTHAQQHQKEATVIQSDWTIDMSALSAKPSMKCSFRKVFLMLLWGLLFLIAGILFFGVLALATMLFQLSTGLLPCDEETCSHIVTAGLMIGSALSGILGLLLGLFGKLPGTK